MYLIKVIHKVSLKIHVLSSLSFGAGKTGKREAKVWVSRLCGLSVSLGKGRLEGASL